MRISLLLALGILGASVCRAAGPTLDEWAIDRSEQRFSTVGLTTVELVNAQGNIRTRGQDGETLEVFNVAQHGRTDKVKVDLLERRTGDRLILELVYREAESGQVTPVPFRDLRRVDLSAFVPHRLNLVIRTRDGFAESKGHQGKLSVTTESGDINIKSKGRVSATSRIGNITSYHQVDRWEGVSRYRTRTGSVVVWLPESPSVDAHVDTAGSITTDFSIDIESRPGSTRKLANARIGAADRKLEIRSVIGDVKLFHKIGFVKPGER